MGKISGDPAIDAILIAEEYRIQDEETLTDMEAEDALMEFDRLRPTRVRRQTKEAKALGLATIDP